jgi:hypothetical protein
VALIERLVMIDVDEVVAVGEVGDEPPPQVTVTAAAMTVVTKRAPQGFKICLPPTTMVLLRPAA